MTEGLNPNQDGQQIEGADQRAQRLTELSEIPLSIDPKKIIQQEGPNTGNIADIDLAQTGAETEEQLRNIPNYSLDIDKVAETSMRDALRHRADKEVLSATNSTKFQLGTEVSDAFQTELEKKREERIAADETKAQKIIGNLKKES